MPDALARPRATGRARAVGGVVAAWRYGATPRDLVRRLKFGRVPAAADPLVHGLADAIRAHDVPGDLLVPVPLATRRRLRRGFDQAAVLARGLATQLELDLACRALRRVRATLPQARRRGRARSGGMGGAFRARPSLVRGRCVLLIDDVLTTGATVRAAAHALRRAGAVSVHVAVACRSEAGRARRRGRASVRRPSESEAPWAAAPDLRHPRPGARRPLPEETRMDDAQPVIEVAGGFVDEFAAAEVAEALNRWFRWILDGSEMPIPEFFELLGVDAAEYAWKLDEDVDWEIGPHARVVGTEVRVAVQTVDTHLPLLGLLRKLGARTTRAVRNV